METNWSLQFRGRGVNRITYWSRGVASLPHKCQPPSPPLDNIRVMVIVWRLRGNVIRTTGLGCVTMFTVSIGNLMPCIIVTWWSGPGGIRALSERPTGFLQCFDIVGLVIWPVKIVPDMTYNVFGGTLNVAQSINQFRGVRVPSRVQLGLRSQSEQEMFELTWAVIERVEAA